MVGKRRAENAVTNIDPRIFKSKPFTALSQHTSNGRARTTRVTAVVNPVLPRLTKPPLPEPPIFTADPSNFAEETFVGNDDDDDEDNLRHYFSAQVFYFGIFPTAEAHPDARIAHSCRLRQNATRSLKNSSDLKAEGSPLRASVNSAARLESIAVSIASAFNFFARVV